MSLSAAHLDALVLAGATGEQIAALVKADMAEREAKAEVRRAKDAERQRRKRSRGVTRTRRDTPPNDNILTPGSEAKASKQNIWICPVGVDEQHWGDFRKNRKRKSCTDSETAYRAVIRDLETFSDDEWPPGRLVQRSAENGWAKIVNPHESKFGNHGHDKSDPTSAAVRSLLGSG